MKKPRLIVLVLIVIALTVSICGRVMTIQALLPEGKKPAEDQHIPWDISCASQTHETGLLFFPSPLGGGKECLWKSIGGKAVGFAVPVEYYARISDPSGKISVRLGPTVALPATEIVLRKFRNWEEYQTQKNIWETNK